MAEKARTHAEIMAGVMGLPKADRDAKIAEMSRLCTCADCPTYEGTGETRLLFCALGKSGAIKAEKDCMCPACPVTPAVALKWNFYCTRGSGLQQGRK